MSRYLPGAILAVCGVLVYGIGCALFLAQRRQRGGEGASKSLFLYAIVMMVLAAEFWMPGTTVSPTRTGR